MTVPQRPRSLHEKITADLAEPIRSGAWPPGFRIPYEYELTRRYGCARATVNKAVLALAAQGLIERRKRAGSFVAPAKAQSAVLQIPDIEALVGSRGQAYRYELNHRHQRPAHHLDPDETHLGARGDVLELACRHFADDKVFAIEDRIIDVVTAPLARQEAFDVLSPGSWLMREVAWTQADHRIGAVAADARMAARLDAAPGLACLSVERWTWRLGEGVTYVRQVFPGDAYVLVAHFTP